MTFTSALNDALPTWIAKVQAAVMFVALALVTFVLGFYSETMGAFVNDHRAEMAFGKQYWPPVALTSAEIGAVSVMVVLWVWLFILVGFTDKIFAGAGVVVATRNRLNDGFYHGAMRFMTVSGVFVVLIFLATLFVLATH